MSTRTAVQPSAPTPATSAQQARQPIGLYAEAHGHYVLPGDIDRRLPPGVLINTDAPMAALLPAAIARTNLAARTLMALSQANLDDVDMEPVLILLAMQVEEADQLLQRMQMLDEVRREVEA